MRGKGETDADGRPILAFAFYYGNAAYYMSERDTWEREELNLDRLLYLYQDNDNQIGNGYERLLAKNGVTVEDIVKIAESL